MTNLCVLARAATAPVVGAINALALLQAASATHRMFRIGAMLLLLLLLLLLFGES
jgi:hypothetical protein